jgi:hypothetical protein
MTLRAIAGENPTLSVATDAELSAIDTGFLVDGDRVWSSASGEYVYRPNSTAALSATVLATSNSDGTTYPGRFLFTGVGPGGEVVKAAGANLAADFTVSSVVLTTLLAVNVTTAVANEQVGISFTVAGHATGAASTLAAQINLDGTPPGTGVNTGTATTSTANTDRQSAAINTLITVPTAGLHIVSVKVAVANAANPFAILASSTPTECHAALVAVKYGVA